MKEVNKITQAVRLALFASVLAVPAVAIAANVDEIEVKAAKSTKVQAEIEDDGLDEELDEEMEQITVTGSRIRRAEFSSASPIQIISGDISRELGMFNTADMLQSSSQSAGTQIDTSFGGFNIDNGPGSSTVGFRGLGDNRTLVLINGKRMVSAGAGGAPAAADLSLIPSVMIDRVETLLDGASSVYGSDAVAGVANILLKKDVEGFEIEGNLSNPKGSGGEKSIFSVMYGKTYDNGYFNIGAEYSNEKSQSLAANSFTSGCDEFLYEDRDGNTYTQDRTIGPLEEGFNNCSIFPLTNRVYFANTLWGSLYRTPGTSNIGFDNFSETTVPYSSAFHPDWYDADSDGDGEQETVFVDADGDGFRDVSFANPFYAFDQSERAKSADLISQTKRFSLVLNGDYDFQDDNNTKVYLEGLYATRESDAFSPGGQLFPTVGVDNPYNPCGTDLYGDHCGGGLVDWGPSTAQPIVNIRGDRDQNDVKVSQYRAVAGLTANINALDNFGAGNWYYDAYFSYAKSTGTYKLQGIDSRRLATSLAAVKNDDGSITCGDGSDGCVPVNFFADNIYGMGGGSFTDAEADYLFTERVAKTYIEQSIISGYISGDLYTLPWNGETVASVFGFEFRKDEIDTGSNEVATEGYLQSFFADKGAKGSRNLRELFAEFEAPLLRGQEFAEELTLSASGRWTEESYYDPETTYSLKAVYRPTEWLTLRGTKGTSYRAPNVRERFILGNTGFIDVTDHCVVPEIARIASDPSDIDSPLVYDASQDDRQQHTMDSCVATGVDPTTLGIGEGDEEFLPTTNIESNTSGTQELNPETSLSKTWGIIFEQPFSEDFELTLSATRFDVEISNSIIEPSDGYVISQCLDNKDEATGGSAFCDKFERNSLGRIEKVSPGFINVGFESAKGYDYNVYYQQDFLISDKNLGVTFDVQATQMTEQALDVLGSYDDNVGETRTPEWRGTARLAFDYNDFRFSWSTKYIGSGKTDDENLSDFAINDPCIGLNDSAGDPVECREIDWTSSYTMHTAALNWQNDNYSVTLGVRNVFNDAPPKVDADKGGVTILRNIPIGAGYDLYGRTMYMNFAMKL
jgi:iron complex outermembrane receptor protein